MTNTDLLYKAAYLISEFKTWDEWASPYLDKTEYVSELGTVRVLHVDSEDGRGENYYGEFPQGSTDPRSMVFEVKRANGESHLFQKSGEADSYGDVSWNGKFQAVKPVEKTVTSYEPV